MSDNGITPLPPGELVQDEKSTAHEGYLHRVAVAVDIEANVLTGGHEDETISSRLARAAEHGNEVGIIGSKLLDVIQHNHCALAQAGDIERAKEVVDLEENSGL